ncbi:NAD(P)/FAD-dependent oxidoreductase [Nocardia sp. NPDC050378]|uniref:flavin-containing monooxygenase n=1 Tax=Nocardia sp. NPDC050378 TaxID=3155400 RepID=UPI0033FC6DF1
MAQTARRDEPLTLDAVIIGAGWAGLYSLIKLRQLGLRVKIVEAGSGVGGTWYWNRYPGARCDVPSLNYSYSFDEDLQRDWHWSERFAAQPEIERYANHVADRFGLRGDIIFGTRVTTASFEEDRQGWTLHTDTGLTIEARWAVFATGGYSAPVDPTIPGWDTFAGETYFTAKWPDRPIEYSGKRVGVIGTGASGMQTITTLADEDLDRLLVFQRTANYVIPGRNRVLSDEENSAIKENYAAFRQRARESGSGTVYDGPVATIADLSDEELVDHIEAAMALGGTSLMSCGRDLLTNAESNKRVQDYLRAEVYRRVADPEVAAKLTAEGHYLGARRVLIENGYLEVFNRDNVDLVDVKSDPIVEITAEGVRTESGFYPLDVIIFATGFDSGTGALSRIDIRGRGGKQLAEKWSAGPATYIGTAIAGFPNLFTIAGPGAPSIRSNVIFSIEQQVDWLAALVAYAQQNGIGVVEATSQAEEKWTTHVNDMVAKTLLVHDDTQYWGGNVPGKTRAYLAYVGGTRVFQTVIDAVRDSDYEGFEMATTDGTPIAGRPVEWSGYVGSGKSRFGTEII